MDFYGTISSYIKFANLKFRFKSDFQGYVDNLPNEYKTQVKKKEDNKAENRSDNTNKDSDGKLSNGVKNGNGAENGTSGNRDDVAKNSQKKDDNDTGVGKPKNIPHKHAETREALNATHAVVGPKEDFFNHAFGSTYEEFEELIYMPELFITKRSDNADKIEQWKQIYRNFDDAEKQQFIELIQNNRFPEVYIENEEIRLLYSWYQR